jgi:hypothetical protein
MSYEGFSNKSTFEIWFWIKNDRIALKQALSVVDKAMKQKTARASDVIFNAPPGRGKRIKVMDEHRAELVRGKLYVWYHSMNLPGKIKYYGYNSLPFWGEIVDALIATWKESEYNTDNNKGL